MIVNKEYIIPRAKLPKVDLLADVIQELLGKEVIRWYLSNVTEDEITVQATLYDDQINQNNDLKAQDQEHSEINQTKTLGQPA
jgi:hypothetical protein